MRRSGHALTSFCALLLLSAVLSADSTPHNLAGGNFSQNWTNTGLITTDDNWSGVPSIVGYRGDDLTTVTGTDPRTILADGTATPVDVIANLAVTTNTTGGVQEIESTILTVALNGSGTADAPFLQLHLNTSTCTNIQVGYNVRDLDGTTDNSVQQVALHYRVGGAGNFTDVPAAYIADATTGPSIATLVTPVGVTLPAAAENQALVVVRVMTTNAVGNDELIGIDDIVVSGNCFVPCSLTCPGNVSVGTAAPACSATVNYPAPSTTGNCGAIVCAPASGSTFPVGTTTVTCTDQGIIPFGVGGPASCSFTVAVADDDPPVLTLPAPIATTTDPGLCTASVPFTATAADNCAGAVPVSCVPPSGSAFPLGQTQVNCSASDVAQPPNVANGSFSVTVTDDEPPTISQADVGPLGTEAPACTAVGSYSPTASDNCAGLVVACAPPSGTAFPPGANPVTCTATDGANLTAQVDFDVLVVDDDAPVVVAPDHFGVPNDPGLCSANVVLGATAADNCDGALTPSCTPPSGSFPVGTTPGTCSATDAANNSGSDPFTVEVLDVEAPVLACSPDLFVETDPGAGTVIVDYPDAGVTDNCAGAGAATCAPPSGSFFPVGTTTVSCSATDAAGNAGSCQFTVNVGGVSILEIPTLSRTGLLLAALGMLGAAVALLRRR